MIAVKDSVSMWLARLNYLVNVEEATRDGHWTDREIKID